MYRDDQKAFEARLEERRERLVQARTRHRALAEDLSRRLALVARRRVLRVLVVVVPLLGLGLVTLGIVSLQRFVFPPARARVDSLESRVAEIAKRSDSARAKLEANERERQRQRNRLRVSPATTTALDQLYGELRYLDAKKRRSGLAHRWRSLVCAT